MILLHLISRLAASCRPFFWGFFLLLSFPDSGFAQLFQVEKLGPEINSPYPEIAPVLSRDGDNMFFTRMASPDFDRTLMERGTNLADSLPESEFLDYLSLVYTQIAGFPVSNPVSSSFNQDIWIAGDLNSENISSTHPKYPLNNALPNSVCSITPFSNSLVLVNQYPDTGGMQKGYSISHQLPDQSWSHPEPITIDSYFNIRKEVNMTMSIDGSIIIFSMEQPDSYGGSDLYVSFRKAENRWGTPKNLGASVNSSFQESTPFLSDDTKTLYFASDRNKKTGIKDIYVLERLDESWQNWSSPKRFVNPINSFNDDSHPCFNASTGYLYFTSDREGQPDIFRVKIAVPNPPFVKVKGKVLDRQSMKPVKARIVSGPTDKPEVRNTFEAIEGSFEITVPKGEEIRITAEKTGYLCEPASFFFKHAYYYFKDYELTLYLDPIKKGMRITLPTLYFKQSLPVIMDRSFPVLDELFLFLSENKGVSLRIEGHTDNQGKLEDLLILSTERAEAVKKYLTDKGISAKRLETKGFGATQPTNDNTTETLRAANRRVEIFITQSD